MVKTTTVSADYTHAFALGLDYILSRPGGRPTDI